MKTWNVGQRVKVAGDVGYIYAIEHDWAAVILDKDSHRTNAPILWAKFNELESE